jgi:hypothetical protein
MMGGHAAPVVWAQVVEVDVRAGVGLTTEVAHKRLATVCPAHVGVHVGLAAPTAHWPQLTQVHNLCMTAVDQQVLQDVFCAALLFESNQRIQRVEIAVHACGPSPSSTSGRKPLRQNLEIGEKMVITLPTGRPAACQMLKCPAGGDSSGHVCLSCWFCHSTAGVLRPASTSQAVAGNGIDCRIMQHRRCGCHYAVRLPLCGCH